MLPPNRLWMPAPMVPTIERDRTTMPRTMPRVRVTRYPGSSGADVVKARLSMAARRRARSSAGLLRDELGLEGDQRVLLLRLGAPHPGERAGPVRPGHAGGDEESDAGADRVGEQAEGREREGEVAGPETLAAQVIPDEPVGARQDRRHRRQREIGGAAAREEHAGPDGRREQRLHRQQVEDEAGRLNQ